jgi:4-aminobutyrate aminotransferase / (S)-3-amino-2-methylpropionate transaminase
MASLLRITSRLRPLASRSLTSYISPLTVRTTKSFISSTSTKPGAAAAATVETNDHTNGSFNGVQRPFFPDEPAGPTVKTAIPGPISKKAIKSLNNVFDTRSLNMMANYQDSFGN